MGRVCGEGLPGMCCLCAKLGSYLEQENIAEYGSASAELELSLQPSLLHRELCRCSSGFPHIIACPEPSPPSAFQVPQPVSCLQANNFRLPDLRVHTQGGIALLEAAHRLQY